MAHEKTSKIRPYVMGKPLNVDICRCFIKSEKRKPGSRLFHHIRKALPDIRKALPAALFLVLAAFPAWTQEETRAQLSTLPGGFMGIRLGMEIESVKDELEKNPYFDFRGDPDVSMLMTPDRRLIECSGYSFIEKGYFQFYEDKLIIMTLVLDSQRLDFYTMQTSFTEKYGRAGRIDPDGAYWEDENVMLNLEKPLSVKYMDKKTLDSITAGRQEAKNTGSRNREEFLDLF